MKKRPETIPQFLTQISSRYANSVAIVKKAKYRRSEWTYQSFRDTVNRYRFLLESRDIQKGDRVLICAPNSPQWVFLFFACAVSGIVIIPLDSNSSTDFIRKVAALTSVKCIIFSRLLLQGTDNYGIPKYFIEDLDLLSNSFDSRRPENTELVLPNDTLEIIFSSGSTGEPKGVVISHKNVCSNLFSLASIIPLSRRKRFLSLLPLSHMLEQTAGLLSPLLWGGRITYIHSLKPRTLVDTCIKEKISSVVCVPAFLELLRNNILQKAEKLRRTHWLRRALSLAAVFPLRARHVLLIPIRKKFGHKLREFFVGGAPLDLSLQQFWNALGISVFQGYGLTEASPLVSTNSPSFHKNGSVGRPLPEVEIRLADDKEILVKGSNVSSGYFNNDEANRKTFEHGWLKTGDIGEIDSDGFLFVRGRKKNIIIGPSGMKIYPEDLETVLRMDMRVKDAVVFAIEKNDALIVAAYILPSSSHADIKEILRVANEKLASHQKIQEMAIWPETDFPRTSTKKVFRDKVAARFNTQSSIESSPAENHPYGQEDAVIQILSLLSHLPPNAITENLNVSTDLKIDSIKKLELSSRLEDELNIEIDESLINQNSTVADLRHLVKETEHEKKAATLSHWPEFFGFTGLRFLFQSLINFVLGFFQTLLISGAPLNQLPAQAIYIANHQSHLDVPSILRALPYRIRSRIAVAAAKDYFFKNKFRGFLSRFIFNSFPLDREGNMRAGLTAIGSLVDSKNSILIFPEGTRTPNGNLGTFKFGIGVIALEMDLPIIPIKISGNFEILPKGKTLPKAGKTRLTFGAPIRISPADSYITITKKLEEAVKIL